MVRSGAEPLERREAERFQTTLKISVSIDKGERGGLLVCPATVHDISRMGALVETKHRLSGNQHVTVAFPTVRCPEGMQWPQAFVGPAMVMRVEPRGNGTFRAGIRFDESLHQNMDFVMFMEFLEATSMSDWLMQQ